ncbi:MAG: hypothetical protein ICV66_05365, partial [Chitinophagaceae bacterium]|nr:hypothetical protein [Chitinophagaceae bacterium]
MKTAYSKVSRDSFTLKLFAFTLLFLVNKADSQTFPPGLVAKFGVDADLTSDERLSGTFTAAGSHDWFKKDNGTGLGMFDTVGKSYYSSQIAAGKNISFTKRIQYASYSIQSNLLMLDGAYSRDNFGVASTTLSSDKTIFYNGAGGNRNYGNPAIWQTVPTGDAIPAKTDIIDAFIHMRRNGTSIQIGNPSNLVVYFAASTLGTDGERYIDFELYKTALSYNSSTGIFSGAGSLTTGGRDIWEFNADGSLKSFGGISLSFSFNSSQVSDISIYIWVPYLTYSTVVPANFDFVAGEWSGSNTSGYGWAKIKAKNGAALPAYGAVNTSTTIGPVWGTNSKDLGSMAGGANYYSTSYGAGQFAEAAIDLTALGIDPALATTFDKCTPPYRRVLVKSRSSNSFSSALQDFIGPFEFLDAPTVPATIINPGPVTCSQTNRVLLPANNITGADYVWSTSDGTIVSGQNSASAVISKGGTYKLTASLYEGCSPTTDSIIIAEDAYKPIAAATYVGSITASSLDSVTLLGGD